MKIAICIAALAALVGTCFHAKTPGVLAANESIIDYEIQGNKFVIIVARENNLSEGGARKLGRQRAAEIAVEQGYRYFVIESESQSQLVRSDGNWPDNKAFYGNMYQELIVEGDFSKQQTSADPGQSIQAVPALRMVVLLVSDKSKPGSLDACKYTDCKK